MVKAVKGVPSRLSHHSNLLSTKSCDWPFQRSRRTNERIGVLLRASFQEKSPLQPYIRRRRSWRHLNVPSKKIHLYAGNRRSRAGRLRPSLRAGFDRFFVPRHKPRGNSREAAHKRPFRHRRSPSRRLEVFRERLLAFLWLTAAPVARAHRRPRHCHLHLNALSKTKTLRMSFIPLMTQ